MVTRPMKGNRIGFGPVCSKRVGPYMANRALLCDSSARFCDRIGRSLLLWHQDLAFSDMIGSRNHPFFLHLLDQSGGLVVADCQLALDIGGGTFAVAHNDAHGLIVKRVFAIGVPAGIQAKYSVDVVGFFVLGALYNAVDIF